MNKRGSRLLVLLSLSLFEAGFIRDRSVTTMSTLVTVRLVVEGCFVDRVVVDFLPTYSFVRSQNIRKLVFSEYIH